MTEPPNKKSSGVLLYESAQNKNAGSCQRFLFYRMIFRRNEQGLIR